MSGGRRGGSGRRPAARAREVGAKRVQSQVQARSANYRVRMDPAILDKVLVDASLWYDGDEGQRAGISSKVDEALREFGFILLKGHHLELGAAQDELILQAQDYFVNSTREEKMKFNRGPYGHQDCGYTPLGKESVAKSIGLTQKDGVESFIFTRNPSLAEGPSPFLSPSISYWKHLCCALRLVHSIATHALQLEEDDFFDKFYFNTPPAEGENGLTLKISYYPPTTADDDERDMVRLRYGEHTDYQGFTLLKPDERDWINASSGGLEVKHRRTGEWMPIIVPADDRETLVVNAGDLLRIWSNDRWHSPIHRVRAPTSQAASGETRCSIIFFTGPAQNTLVQPICCDSTPVYTPIRAGEHLMQKILASQV